MTDQAGEVPPSEPARVLILDDEPTVVLTLNRILTMRGWDVVGAHSIQEATVKTAGAPPDAAIIDVFLGAEDGLQFTRDLRKKLPETGIIMISGEDTETLAKKAITSGADYFLSKPITPAALTLTLQSVIELRRQRRRAAELEQELKKRDQDHPFPEILTHSDAMKSVLRMIEKVGMRDLSVMIYGESGTGKELVANAIHRSSSRATGNFVELNCAALPPNLVESELFGHEKGSFTGAVASRAGKIELADHGTLFLDEIGELPLETQPKLLRALQEKRITRVGGKKDIECDFRLVSATHRDLQQEVKAGRFREDLFYRVAVFPVKLPPLRERMEDLDLLLTRFLNDDGMRSVSITDEARAMLNNYYWPGNVRELKNFAQAITLMIEKDVIDDRSVSQYFGSRLTDTPDFTRSNGHSGRSVRKLEEVERDEIFHALRVHQGSVPDAATALGMGRATLYKYIKRHDIELRKFY
ncbi:sigma-54 dependent transcriptional regulator [soil metagenome]